MASELQHINIKLFVDGELVVDLERFIEVFHRWTAKQTMEELLIDVADYRHVPAGPGVVLVGHEADYAMDNAGDSWGLLYNRKTSMEGSNRDRLRQAFGAAARACQLLEAEFASSLRFSSNRFQIIINDRALSPNTPETLDACKAELKDFVRELLGHDEFSLTAESDPRRRFGMLVESAQPFDLSLSQGAS